MEAGPELQAPVDGVWSDLIAATDGHCLLTHRRRDVVPVRPLTCVPHFFWLLDWVDPWVRAGKQSFGR